MIRALVCGVLPALVVLAGILYFVRRQKPTAGDHERIASSASAPTATSAPTPFTPGVPDPDLTLSGVEGLRHYLKGALPRPTRRNRAGMRFLLGKYLGDYVVVVRLPTGVHWRYVCTADSLWGARRPSEECLLADNASVAELDLLDADKIQELLKNLTESYPV